MAQVLAIMSAASNEWAIYILGAITVAYIIFRPMMRRKKDPLEHLPPLSLSQQKTVERDMQNLLVELSEMARQITAQLDTRSAKLEAMIDEADRKLAELDRKLAGSANPDGNGALTDAGCASAHQNPEPCNRRCAEAHPAPAEKRESSSDEAPRDRYAEIHALADQGRTAGEIAHRLGRPQGEVELILALRGR